MDQEISVKIELTANHQGFMEFRLCPQNNPLVPASQACLDRHLLERVDGAGTRFHPGPGNKVFEVRLELPEGLTCSQCVLQWRYVAANNWGVCKNGTGKVGCGAQEEFRACSDVSVRDESGRADTSPNMDRDEQEVEEIWDNSVDWEEDDIYPEDRMYQYTDITMVTTTPGDNGERVAVIVLSSLLTAVLLFGAVFLYYYKVRNILSDLDVSASLPSLPPLPSLPSIPQKFKLKLPNMDSIPVPKLCDLEKLSSPKWPLSSVSLSHKLPYFSSSAKVRVRPEISAPLPIPPPRTRRGRSRATSPEAQTEPGTGGHRRSVASGPLEISGPTEVTINGVTVGSSSGSVMGHTADHGPQPSSRGVICQAPVPSARVGAPGPGLMVGGPVTSPGPRLGPVTGDRSVWAAQPALVNSDQPDSSLDCSVPPPLPECPPPEDSLVISLGHEDRHTDA